MGWANARVRTYQGVYKRMANIECDRLYFVVSLGNVRGACLR